jgi:hypothetical protein
MKIATSELEHLREEVKNCHQIIKDLQKKREFVGLTPDEYRQLEKETTVNGYNGDYCPAWDLIEAVEAKLKEKNA